MTHESESTAARAAGRAVSQSVEDYIKTIYGLQQQEHARVSTNDIARVLGTSAASVTKMSKYLAEHNLLTHEPYYGVRLTSVGEKIALETIRHHRLIELYLVEALGYGWDEVDAEAERLEHHISEAFEERIDQMLGRPQTDPHGHPIPTREGFIAPLAGTRLDLLPTGEALTVVRVSDNSPQALRRLSEIGVRLGVRVEVLEASRTGGSLQVAIEGVEHTMDADLVSCLFADAAAPRGSADV